MADFPSAVVTGGTRGLGAAVVEAGDDVVAGLWFPEGFAAELRDDATGQQGMTGTRDRCATDPAQRRPTAAAGGQGKGSRSKGALGDRLCLFS